MTTGARSANVVSTNEFGGAEVWWRTVTPQELRSATKVIEKFLEGNGTPPPAEVETFARAIALRQLLFEDTAVMNVLGRVRQLVPSLTQGSAAETALVTAETWLPRGEAIGAGLTRTLEIVLPHESDEWAATLRRFLMQLQILRSECAAAAIHAGLRSAMTARPPRRLGRRDV